ncbi:hypothetical protein Ddye_013651 [Dipteronia dyeriana]|uniref:BED-type domain-containing protein n=1 Tax=Dipteronia dyeriana TaxID=168575 RepID=A0AAD9X6P6_9ROSI|nr:hypothetical protein Ddye_013651 [Dipteronia dyeriana]
MDSSSNNDVIPSLGEEEEGNDTMEPVEANSRSNTPTGSGQDRKRKRTSAVWSSFVIVGKNAQGKEHCKCKYCGKQYICEGTHGTGNMKRHIEFQCPKIMMHDPRQMLLKNNKSANMTVSNPKSQNEFRTIVAETIVLHDLPFSFVEWSGVRKMIGYCTDEFHMVSRNTAKADVLSLYCIEKTKVKTLLEEAPGRICLTSDLWTSIATDGYMCLTAHFIDKNWVLQKKVLSFCFMPPPHDRVSLADKIKTLLCEWKIENRIFSITLDNASSNNSLVHNLKSHLNINKALLCDGEFLHIRCCAHIINLIVQDGLKEIDGIVHKVRESVKYARASQTRKQKFLECIKRVHLDSKRGLRQDVPTRWNSTYLMLDSAIYYRLAWTALELADSNYKHCPSESEWENVEKLCKFLRHFYDTTNLFSGTKYPTSNLYMPKVFITYLTLMQNLASDDPFFKAMSNQMYTKFNKYWFDFSTILAIAIILDPRYKMEFVMFVYERLYGAESKQLEEVKGKLFALFNEYVTSSTGRSTIRPSPQSYPSTSSGRQRVDDLDLVLLDFDNNINGDIVDIQRTQLDLYLEERRLERSIDLNILDFWKGNEPCYPELAAMARDVLSVPISRVASESAFSMGGRVLDQFRSSLLPNVAEALVCSRDWILGNGESAILKCEEITKDLWEMEDDSTPASTQTMHDQSSIQGY